MPPHHFDGSHLGGEGAIAKEFRINERIRAREVRLIGPEGQQVGIVPSYEALRMAREASLDLVEVAPAAVPPVCRILDYGKFKYEQTKKEREARKNQKISELKGMRLRPKIDDHDLEFKTRTVAEFLSEGDKVKVTVIFRGREIAHSDLGRKILDKVVADLKDVALVERPPFMEGKTMTVILTPLGKKSGGSAAPRPQGVAEERGQS
jgi:translation initiation factor IF-3